MNLFNKILIANRGEIACRIMVSCKKLGISTVAVFSDADANAKHVKLADEAIHIGASPVSESYLNADRIISAALATNAQAIHPGYGFLSENPDFVRAVEKAGLVFIGPSAKAIDAMGLKDAAKDLMKSAGVPVVPGYHGAAQDAETLAKEADKIGYPVLIKARAGGGGKGMRLVESPANFKDSLEAAQREGQASFGDPICLIEKYIAKPRHIEVQIFGDNHGNVVHLFERDCSLQRRHQKVIEEAPAPDMPDSVRDAMGKAAVEAAKAIAYSGAGTVEFIADGSSGLKEDGFWFMEMNTRLQVEHPVSEAITGLDFVELQLRVAAGEPLPIKQSELAINGWAIEARVYAEDVAKGFLPATGVIEYLSFPKATEFEHGALRVDSGIEQADEISPFYDPMIAKVIVHGPNRAVALNRLTSALTNTCIAGSVTNLNFLTALSTHAGFASGDVDTHLIARDIDELTVVQKPDETALAIAAIWSLGLLPKHSKHDKTLWHDFTGWRHWSVSSQNSIIVFNDETINRTVSVLSANVFKVDAEAGSTEIGIDFISEAAIKVRVEGAYKTLQLVGKDLTLYLFENDQTFTFRKKDAMAEQNSAQELGGNLIAPMPGSVMEISAVVGQSVSAGDKLMVLEAMKMEHALQAPRDGVVAEILFNTGDQVIDGALLLRLEPVND